MGQERVSLYSMLIGSVIKLAVNYMLIGMPSVGIAGAPVGTVLCYAVIMVINFAVILRSPQVTPRKWGRHFKTCFGSSRYGRIYLFGFPMAVLRCRRQTCRAGNDLLRRSTLRAHTGCYPRFLPGRYRDATKGRKNSRFFKTPKRKLIFPLA